MTITAQEVPDNLSKKIDFLLDNREFTKVQQRNIRCRLNKKVKVLLGSELPILQAKGSSYTAATAALKGSCNTALLQTSNKDTKRA